MFFKTMSRLTFTRVTQGHHVRVAISTGDPLEGELPPRASRLVKEWTELHRTELEEDWRLARELRPLNAIEPLP